MSITMQIIQQFDASKEREFMKLEKKFAELESSRTGYPKGKRMQPISAKESCNSIIWQCEFPNIQAAYEVLNFFQDDGSHEKLLVDQLPFFKQVKIEFYKNLDF